MTFVAQGTRRREEVGKVVRGIKSTYKRHGAVNLFAALTVATGAIHSKVTAVNG